MNVDIKLRLTISNNVLAMNIIIVIIITVIIIFFLNSCPPEYLDHREHFLMHGHSSNYRLLDIAMTPFGIQQQRSELYLCVTSPRFLLRYRRSLIYVPGRRDDCCSVVTAIGS